MESISVCVVDMKNTLLHANVYSCIRNRGTAVFALNIYYIIQVANRQSDTIRDINARLSEICDDFCS